MGLLDDHNALHGAFSERRGETTEHPLRWADAGVVCSILWLFGFGSLLGAAAGVYVLTGEAPAAARRLAKVAVVVGVVGICLALVLAMRLIEE